MIVVDDCGNVGDRIWAMDPDTSNPMAMRRLHGSLSLDPDTARTRTRTIPIKDMERIAENVLLRLSHARALEEGTRGHDEHNQVRDNVAGSYNLQRSKTDQLYSTCISGVRQTRNASFSWNMNTRPNTEK